MRGDRLEIGKDNGELNMVYKAMHIIDLIFKDSVIRIVWKMVVRLQQVVTKVYGKFL